MQELKDTALLREYIERDSEEAFATLVQRNVNKVYSVALRHTRNSHQAEEITQAVFVILAQKARRLSKRVVLSGWLYQTARLTAITFIRGEIRRAHREQEAYMKSALNETESDVWPQIVPLLDAAMAALNETDRHAVVLRFFDGKSMSEIGAELGSSEDAAKMRVNRAVEKMRSFFTKRGVDVPAATLTAAIAANSVQIAPPTLAQTATALAFAKGATASAPTLALIKGALNLMAWANAKTAIVAGIAVLLAAGATTAAFKEIQQQKTYPWQVAALISGDGSGPRLLDQQPPQVAILPSKITNASWVTAGNKIMGTGASPLQTVQAAYDFRIDYKTATRSVLLTELPDGKFDFIACLPDGNKEALQSEVKRQFGVDARHETRGTDVLLLTVKNRSVKNIKPSTPESDSSGNRMRPGKYVIKNAPLEGLRYYLENYFEVPVIDRTGLDGPYDVDMTWDDPDWHHHKPDSLKQALLDQLGFELVPTNMPIEMLVIDKAK